MSLAQSKLLQPIPRDFTLVVVLCVCGVIHLLQLIYIYIYIYIYIFHMTVSYIKCKNKNLQYVQSSLTFRGFVLCGFAKLQGNPKNETKTKFPEHCRKF